MTATKYVFKFWWFQASSPLRVKKRLYLMLVWSRIT